MKARTYIRQNDTFSTRELRVYIVALILMMSALFAPRPMSIVLLLFGFTALVALHIVAISQGIAYISQYRQPINRQQGGFVMSTAKLELKIHDLDSDVRVLPRMIQETQASIKQLSKEAQKIRSHRIPNIIQKQSHVRELFKNERELAVINNKLRFLRQEENDYRRKLDKEKLDLNEANSFYRRAVLGDMYAAHKAEQVLAHY